MSSTSLPGYDLLGCTYDVKEGYYANPVSVNGELQLFDFSYAPESGDCKTVHMYGETDYTYPSSLYLVTMSEAEASKYESKSSEELNTSSSISLGLEGSYGAFSAEVSIKYSTSYTSSNSFEHLMERALVQSFKLTLPKSSSLRDYLKAEAKSDIDTMDATALVKKYGTHFLWEGIYGGRWDYSQSISKYSCTTSSEMEASFEANYGDFVSGKVEQTSQTDKIRTEEQSDAYFHCYGGKPETLAKGYETWAASVKEGNFVLVEFTDDSLQPLSVLAEGSARQAEILAAIEAAMGGDDLVYSNLAVGDTTKDDFGNGDVDRSVYLPSGWVMTGMAASFSDTNVTRLAVEGLNLATNTRAWYDRLGETNFNSEEYQSNASVPTGFVVTGLGVRLDQHSFKNWVLYYQTLDPMNVDNNHYLSCEDSDPQELVIGSTKDMSAEYHPAASNGKVITGVGICVQDTRVTNLELGLAQLEVVKE